MKKILLIRNDKLGDFMLAFPCFAAAKNNLPHIEIHALVPAYTEAMARSCQWVDNERLLPPQVYNIFRKDRLLLCNLLHTAKIHRIHQLTVYYKKIFDLSCF